MPPRERGRTPAGFREQLLQHLRNGAARDGILVQRVQQRVAFERLMARLPQNGEWVLKGGLALLFRYGLQTRPTKDLDLRTPRDVTEAVDSFRQTVAAAMVNDNFSFEFGEVAQEMQGAPGGSRRIRVVARVAGRDFAAFHVDLSSGDALVDQPDLLQGSDILQFAGIAPVRFPVYPVAQHLAEKLHVYTLPRAQENTRVRTSSIWSLSPPPRGLRATVSQGVLVQHSPHGELTRFRRVYPSRQPPGKNRSRSSPKMSWACK